MLRWNVRILRRTAAAAAVRIRFILNTSKSSTSAPEPIRLVCRLQCTDTTIVIRLGVERVRRTTDVHSGQQGVVVVRGKGRAKIVELWNPRAGIQFECDCILSYSDSCRSVFKLSKAATGKSAEPCFSLRIRANIVRVLRV